MKGRLAWEIDNSGAEIRVKVSGAIDEDAVFAPLLAKLDTAKPVRIDVSGVSRVNSCGVREWVNFIRNLPPAVSVCLEGCSPPMVNQINMISNFTGTARVVSVQAPYLCKACGNDEQVLVEVAGDKPPATGDRVCAKCGGTMEFDDLEDSYFAFLTRR